jgi:type I restriction enzyme S subunit
VSECRVRDICDVNPQTPEFDALAQDEYASFLPMEGVWPDHLQLENRPRGAIGDGYTRFREGDVLVPKITPTFEHGRSCVAADLTNGLGAGTTELHVLRPKPSVSARWLFYLTKSASFLQFGSASMYGVAGQKRVSTDWIKSFPLQLPSLDDQRRIAGYLDEQCARIDALIADQERLASLTETRVRSRARELVTGRMSSVARCRAGASVPYWLGPVNADWAARRVGWSFSSGSGTTPSSSNPDFFDGPHPWVNTGELRDSVIERTSKSVTDEAMERFSALKYFPTGSVIVAMYGATIGRVAILGIPATVNQACCALYGATDIDPWFLFYWLWSHREEIARLGEGGGQPNINQEIIRSLRVPSPDLAEQRNIAETIRREREASERVAEETDRQIALLTEHRQALITAAVTGQLPAAAAA